MQKNWAFPQLKELTSFVIGGDWGKDPLLENSEEFEGVFCIRGSEFKNWNNKKGETASFRKIKKASLEKRELKKGDVLLEISGGGPDQPVGRTVIIDDETLNRNASYPKVCTNFFRLVRFHENLNKEFLNHYLQYFYHSGEVVQYQGGSNNLRNLKYKEYETINIPLPPLPEQNRIVAKLDKLFEQLEVINSSLEKIPLLLKNFRQQVLTQAVTGKLTEEWRQEKELGEWIESNIDDVIVSIKSGKNFNCPGNPVSGDDVGLVKISAVTWGVFDEKQTKTVLDENKINPELFINKGDFLISRANTLELVGSCLIVDSIKHKIMLSDKIWRVSFQNEWTKKFINFYLKSNKGREEIQSRASGNQHSMRNLSQKEFKKIPFLKPSLSEQEEIVKRVESLFAKADAIESEFNCLKQKLDKLPQSILHKAFKGELLPQLESDGDARELLEGFKQLKSLFQK